MSVIMIILRKAIIKKICFVNINVKLFIKLSQYLRFYLRY